MLCRKHGKGGCCCCCPSEAKDSSTNDDEVTSPTDLKPRYYFGVTAEDLHQAGETPSYDNDVTYISVTTPPPDVVPSTTVDII